MSWQASKWSITQRAGSSPAKAVLLVLAEAANARTRACYLSHAMIAERAELGERTVGVALQTLEDGGLIERTRRFDRFGHRTTDLIELNTGQPAAGAVRRGRPKPHDVREGACRPNRTSRNPYPQETTSLPAGGAEEPIREPVSEPVSLFDATQAPALPKAPRQKPRTALPDAFPDAAALATMGERFRAAGLAIDLEAERQKFRDHHQHKGTLSASWPAALSTWTSNGIRYAKERAQRGPGSRGGGGTGADWIMRDAE